MYLFGPEIYFKGKAFGIEPCLSTILLTVVEMILKPLLVCSANVEKVCTVTTDSMIGLDSIIHIRIQHGTRSVAIYTAVKYTKND